MTKSDFPDDQTIKSRTAAVVPARLASTRFPKKMLASDTGKPLIVHTLERVRQANLIGRIAVATDDAGIKSVCEGYGFEAYLTDPSHPSGTDRIAEVVRKHLPDSETILNVQGDEPEISPSAIDHLILLFEQDRIKFGDAAAPMGTLAREIDGNLDIDDPHVVKVVIDKNGRALYFSRRGIPYHRDTGKGASYKHLGIYIFRREFLLSYPMMEQTPLERAEKLEQLRALENGYPIVVGITRYDSHGVDTEHDYQGFVERHGKGSREQGVGSR
ncbi:MAG: 3-deoxy-manno-octulosonate cytidylyltransferase [Planctomycetes bacterium]|nr:3-deoxy-manno-octulosonate cytidylyltransferase [Planctomycetota bacterium]